MEMGLFEGLWEGVHRREVGVAIKWQPENP